MAEGGGRLKDPVERPEARILRETLVMLRHNRTRTADVLGPSRTGLRAKLDRYGIGWVETLRAAE